MLRNASSSDYQTSWGRPRELDCSQLKLVSGGGRMEVAAGAGRASDEGRRLANLFHQVALDCKVRLSLDKEILLVDDHFLENINLTRRGCHRW